MAYRWLLKPQLLLFSPLVALLLIAMACGEDDTPTPLPTATSQPPTATPIPTPVPKDAGFLAAPEANAKYGGVLKYGGIGSSTLYDLHQTGSYSNLGPQAPKYDLLVQIDPINWNEIIPDLAKSWKVSNDELTYEFTLREGVKFHDGSPLTAGDVEASFNHIIFPPEGVLSPRKGLFGAVTEVVATGPMTVEFRLSDPRGFLLAGIKAGFNVIMRKADLEANDFDLKRIPDYPGTGPFRHAGHEPKISWTLERNPDYWNEDLPYLDGIESFHSGYGGETGAACLAHTVDFCWGIDIISHGKAQGIEELNTSFISPTTFHGMYLNMDNKPFDDVRVRRAINLVINKAEMNQAVSDLTNMPQVGWVWDTDPLFTDYWATDKDKPGFRAPTAEDIAEAKQLMVDAGYGDGVKDVDLLVRDVSTYKIWAPIVQDVLMRELNIDATPRIVASGVWFEEAGAGRYDISLVGQATTIPHVADYWSAMYKTDGGFNWQNYSNPAFDAIVDKTAAEADPAKLKTLVDQGVAILEVDVPLILWGGNTVAQAWWNDVKGHRMDTKLGNFWEGNRRATWWLDR